MSLSVFKVSYFMEYKEFQTNKQIMPTPTIILPNAPTFLTTTLDDSHRTGIIEVGQAIKSVEENIEYNQEMKIWDQTKYL